MTHGPSFQGPLLALACHLALAACGSTAIHGADAAGQAADASSEASADVVAPSPEAGLVPADAAGFTNASAVAADGATVGGGEVAHSAIFVTQDELNQMGHRDPNVDPRTLVVLLGTRPKACADPLHGYGACGWWEVSFRLPPDLQHPGSWHLDGPPIEATLEENGPDRGGDNCGSSGGPVSYGDLTILDINERTIVLKIERSRSFFYGDTSGTYTVERCPIGAASSTDAGASSADAAAAIDASPDGPGTEASPDVPWNIVLTQGQLNDLGYGNRLFDPQTLNIFVGAGPISCRDPYRTSRCPGFSFMLQPEQQHLGTWLISGLPIDAMYCEDHSDGDFLRGKVTVLELGEHTVRFKLEDALTPFHTDFSGTYTAERCP